MDNETKNNLVEDLAKKVYDDVGAQVAKPTGELIGLIPRAIKAALAPFEQWILQKEYNVAETKRLLEERLKDVSPESIQPPEAYIAVPALQYISYCMDNKELRNMYANLLANSMNKAVKNGVHPSFVEIIKQLSPDEAKVLKHMLDKPIVPTITLRVMNKDDESGVELYKNFSNIGELAGCEMPYDINRYFDNLIRLGLVECAPYIISLKNENLYKDLIEHGFVNALSLDQLQSLTQKEKYSIGVKKSYIKLTSYGRSFCEICLPK